MEENTEIEKSAEQKISPIILVGVVALLAVFGFGLLKGAGGNSTTGTLNEIASAPTSVPEPVVEGMAVDTTLAEGVRVIALEAGSFYYKPDVIRVKVGEKVRIEMSAVDMMHDFNVDELDVSIPITRSGGVGTVEFVADKAGSYEFYCNVGSHRQNGQTGMLIVE